MSRVSRPTTRAVRPRYSSKNACPAPPATFASTTTVATPPHAKWNSPTTWRVMSAARAEMLYGAADADALFARLAQDGVTHAALKRGDAGAQAVRDGRQFEVAAHPAPAVVDTCGAGDAFNAGYLSALLHGFATKPALRLAAYCAAQVVASESDNEALPSWNDARALGMLPKIAR